MTDRTQWDPLVRLAVVEDDVVALQDTDARRDEAGRRLIRRATYTVMIVALVTGVGLWFAQRAGDTATAAARKVAVAQARADDQDAASKLRSCVSTNEFRRTQAKALAHTLVPAPPFDPTDDPTFSAQPLETQDYVRSLVARLGAYNAARDRAAADEYARKFPILSCADQEHAADVAHRRYVALTT